MKESEVTVSPGNNSQEKLSTATAAKETLSTSATIQTPTIKESNENKPLESKVVSKATKLPSTPVAKEVFYSQFDFYKYYQRFFFTTYTICYLIILYFNYFVHGTKYLIR